jgi:hypothetical protein
LRGWRLGGWRLGCGRLLGRWRCLFGRRWRWGLYLLCRWRFCRRRLSGRRRGLFRRSLLGRYLFCRRGLLRRGAGGGARIVQRLQRLVEIRLCFFNALAGSHGVAQRCAGILDGFLGGCDCRIDVSLRQDDLAGVRGRGYCGEREKRNGRSCGEQGFH